ncbi:MAG TPA: hypothetical protein VLB90_10195 [Pseudomonadales bacterium]|nr:hypothetical protein [Pseudomonadales bacterium]
MKSIIFATSVLLLLGGFFLGFSGSVDDAHITFWSAWALAHDGQIVNYNFERVEQTTALLQVLLLAVLHKLSNIPVVDLAHITTILSAIVVLVLSARLYKHIDQQNPARQNVVQENTATMLLLLATSPFFVYWSFGGMEGPMLACMLLLCILYWSDYLRGERSTGMLLALVLATQSVRSELPLVMFVGTAGIVVAKLLLRDHLVWRWNRIVLLAAVQLLVALLLLGWRWWYFDSLWPQPVAAKIGGSFVFNVWLGLGYAWQAISDPFLVLSALIVLLSFPWLLYKTYSEKPQHELLLVAIVAAAYSAFIISSGGDWMAAGRFWMPITPLFVVLIAWLLSCWCKQRAWLYGLVSLMLVGNIGYLWHGTTVDFNNVPLWKKTKLSAADHEQDFSFFERHSREHLHDIPTAAFVVPLVQDILARRHDGKPVEIMTGQAGMVMYHLATTYPRQLHITDRNGLIERTFTDCDPARDLPRTRIGLGNGYEWIMEHRIELQQQCGMKMPDIVFDVAASRNQHNNDALRQLGYVFLYNQRGHIVEEGDWLPLRKIGAGQFIAVSPDVWQLLGKPEPVSRVF